MVIYPPPQPLLQSGTSFFSPCQCRHDLSYVSPPDLDAVVVADCYSVEKQQLSGFH